MEENGGDDEALPVVSITAVSDFVRVPRANRRCLPPRHLPPPFLPITTSRRVQMSAFLTYLPLACPTRVSRQVHVLSAVLERLVETNRPLAAQARITKFSAAKRPAISVIDYLLR